MRYLIFYTALQFIIARPLQGQAIMPYAPELFPPGISGGVCGFSPDGKTIYFSLEDSSLKKTFIYQARRKGKKWNNMKLMSFSGTHNDYSGRISPDGNRVYFTSDRPGANSKTDDKWNIWVAEKKNKEWQMPAALNEINSTGNECCAVPLKDGSVLFSADRGERNRWLIYQFKDGALSVPDSLNNAKAWQWPSAVSENGQVLILNSMLRTDGLGMDDIYLSLHDDKDGWKPAVNAGPPVNTSGYEDGAIISPDGKWLIFCRHATAESPSQVLCTGRDDLKKKLHKD